MGRREDSAWARGTVGLTVARERGDVDRKFQNRLIVTPNMIDRLGLQKELHGHMGCVNCLEWNSDGSVLASASDDLHVILWDPYRYKQLHKIATGHTGNIFSVKFLASDALATCAADRSVRAQTLSGITIWECSCHRGRVKRLATAPDNPYLFWSAGEDGLILQHDVRTAHRCNSGQANVVVNLFNALGRYCEAKCVAVNPRRPYQMAVGANDFYVRVYDRRMIKLTKSQLRTQALSQWGFERQSGPSSGDSDNEIACGAVQYFAPGHLSLGTGECQRFPKKVTTYVAYSHDGNELLVNLGCEQVYLYDINTKRRPVFVESFILEDVVEEKPPPKKGANGTVALINGGSDYASMPERVRELKESGHELVGNGDYTAAVDLFNTAIEEFPDQAVLYSNRATTLMRRGWAGDTYAAIRDCYEAIRLEPGHVKAHFRLAKALMELHRPADAERCLAYFERRFPRHAASHAVFLLQKDIRSVLDAQHSGDISEKSPAESSEEPPSELEKALRVGALDYERRFIGHCNTTTDIKEANFLGPDAAYIAAGSDDGNLFIWSRESSNIVKCLRADDQILNCVQMHPSMLLLATSGIETPVRLWSPQAEEESAGVEGAGALVGVGERALVGVGERSLVGVGERALVGLGERSLVPLGEAGRAVVDLGAAARANQQRMRSDPFEAMLFNISFNDGVDRVTHPAPCRTT